MDTPIQPDYSPEQLTEDSVEPIKLIAELDNYSASDIRLIAEKARSAALNRAIELIEAGNPDPLVKISPDMIRDAIAETRRSITDDMLAKYEAFDRGE